MLKESVVTLDPLTERIAKNYDYSFDGRSSFKCIPKPKTPQSYNIGVIHGPAGSGNTTLRKEYGDIQTYMWAEDMSVVSHFQEVDGVNRLMACGLNSVPTWCKPYHVLSNGEKFRADLARGLENRAIFDEYTSVVNRTVAMSASIALAKYVRANNLKITIATCHDDVLEWLKPDWSFDTKDNSLVIGRCLYREPIRLDIVEGDTSYWPIFKNHHYLTGKIQKGAKVYLCYMGKELIAMSASIYLPGKIPLYWPDEKASGVLRGKWREHRLVVLPDYQGLGIGVRMSDCVGQLFLGRGLRYFSKTAHPRMGEYRQKSGKWRATSTNLADRSNATGPKSKLWKHFRLDTKRICYSHEYLGSGIMAKENNE